MNPYSSQQPKAFWRTGVTDQSPLNMAGLYQPKFPITKDMRITAAGSCFAQHIGAQFKKRGYNFTDVEPVPAGFPPEKAHEFGFDLYSARYGNVYSVRQLVQMFARAKGRFEPKEIAFLEKDGRVRDPFRPAIEPDGFADAMEMKRDRTYHLAQVAGLAAQTDLFVFTFGLTEAWECIADGAILPTCPGTVGGKFDPKKYRFKNFTFAETYADAEEFIAYAMAKNPQMKFLFTVSPVPLTATATDDHVLAATVYSKSVLRAVCGELRAKYANVDYFPSYEMVASHPMRAMYFMSNLRAVAPEGVAIVMNTFFTAHGDTGAPAPAAGEEEAGSDEDRKAKEAEELVCEEAILDTFRV